MYSQSLVGYLAGKMTQQRENLATEALGFILRVAEARQALVQVLDQAGVSLPKDMLFHTQATGENLERPDLCGRDGDCERLLIEAKFWAGLTENQPNAYLKRLAASKTPSALFFIAPEKRLESLWAEILRICKEPAQPRETISGWYKASLDGNRFLLLTSWRVILQRIKTELESAGHADEASDVRQLEGLANRMDDEAFLPLRSVDFSPEIPRLISLWPKTHEF